MVKGPKAKTKAKAISKLEADILAITTTLSLDVGDIGGGEGKAYETWLLFSLVDRLRTKGVDVDARDHKDDPTTTFRVKGGPGNIVGASAKGLQPCHFQVVGDNKWPLELHVSIEHVGRSGTTHEVDISLIPKFVAEHIRHGLGGAPYRGPRHLCLELKNYAATSELDKNIARAFLGAWLDLHGDGYELFGSYVMHARRTPLTYSLVTSAMVGASSMMLLGEYDLSAFSNVYPGTHEADLFLDTVAQHIQAAAS